MKTVNEKRVSDDIEEIKNHLIGLRFVCNSFPSAQNLIYTKNGDVVIIKNDKK